MQHCQQMVAVSRHILYWIQNSQVLLNFLMFLGFVFLTALVFILEYCRPNWAGPQMREEPPSWKPADASVCPSLCLKRMRSIFGTLVIKGCFTCLLGLRGPHRLTDVCLCLCVAPCFRRPDHQIPALNRALFKFLLSGECWGTGSGTRCRPAVLPGLEGQHGGWGWGVGVVMVCVCVGVGVVAGGGWPHHYGKLSHSLNTKKAVKR